MRSVYRDFSLEGKYKVHSSVILVVSWNCTLWSHWNKNVFKKEKQEG